MENSFKESASGRNHTSTIETDTEFSLLFPTNSVYSNDLDYLTELDFDNQVETQNIAERLPSAPIADKLVAEEPRAETGNTTVPIATQVLAPVPAQQLSEPPKPKRRINFYKLIPLLAALAFIITGFVNGHTTEVIDQEAREATFSDQPTGLYDLNPSAERICQPGDEVSECISLYTNHYLSVCTGSNLTADGKESCANLNSAIERMHEVEQACAEQDLICEMEAENTYWGWAYFHELTPEIAPRSNNDNLPMLSHLERCVFNVGVIRIGNCA